MARPGALPPPALVSIDLAASNAQQKVHARAGVLSLHPGTLAPWTLAPQTLLPRTLAPRTDTRLSCCTCNKQVAAASPLLSSLRSSAQRLTQVTLPWLRSWRLIFFGVWLPTRQPVEGSATEERHTCQRPCLGRIDGRVFA
eukprot:363062-Chlamydomonas_euryale.AAC.2